MRAPVVICNGVIRSGSTWSFNVCRELVQEDAVRNKKAFGSAYLDSQPLEQFITTPQPPAALAVIKAHGLGNLAMTALRQGKARAVCTFRDPRDCIASDLAFMNYPFEVAIKRIAVTLDPLRVYQTTPNILLVRYEDMMTDRFREIRRIADHLGVEVDANDVRRIDARTNMDNSQRVCKEMQQRPSDQLIKIANHLVDPTTHLHENHINGGTMGRWKDELSIDQAVYLTEFFASWLLQLGYETPESLRAILTSTAARRQVATYQAPAQQAPRFGSFTVGAAGSARFANT